MRGTHRPLAKGRCCCRRQRLTQVGLWHARIVKVDRFLGVRQVPQHFLDIDKCARPNCANNVKDGTMTVRLPCARCMGSIAYCSVATLTLLIPRIYFLYKKEMDGSTLVTNIRFKFTPGFGYKDWMVYTQTTRLPSPTTEATTADKNKAN